MNLNIGLVNNLDIRCAKTLYTNVMFVTEWPDKILKKWILPMNLWLKLHNDQSKLGSCSQFKHIIIKMNVYPSIVRTVCIQMLCLQQHQQKETFFEYIQWRYISSNLSLKFQFKTTSHVVIAAEEINYLTY